MLKPCGCVWGIETSPLESRFKEFKRAAEASGRMVTTMDHDEARARLFVCEHEKEKV